MKMNVGRWSRCGLAVLMMAGVPLLAQTAAKAAIVAGQERTVLETTQKIVLKVNPLHGTTRIETTGTGAAPTSRLLYKANLVREKTTDSLDYALDSGASAQRIVVEIDPAPEGLSAETYQESFKAIFLLFVLAAVLESALAVLFNWRPFIETFNARAVRPLVSFLAAGAIAWIFSLDLITTLINVSTNAHHDPGIFGKMLTAMVVAGGSAGVNNLLVELGYREKKTPETVAPKPPPDKAWISVRLNRKGVKGPVELFIGPPPAAGAATAVAGVDVPLVGVIQGESIGGLRYFFSDPGRFPTYGGHQIPKDTLIMIMLKYNNTANVETTKRWGPSQVAAGAIVDLDISL